MEGLKYPKLTKEKAKFYDEEESSQLLNLIQNEPLSWKALIILALTTGMRRGEICGLEWKHVDFDKGTIEIEQGLIYTTATKKQLTDTKSKGSHRIIAMPEMIQTLLRTLKSESMKQRLALGSRWKGGDRFFVFTNFFGEPYVPETISKKWKTFITEKGFKYVKLHGLRHTSASLLINKGVHAKVISDRLGHSNINITMNTYGHVFRKADEGAAKTFDDIFNPSPARPQINNK